MKKITRVALGIASVALLTFGLIGMSQLDAGNKVRLHHGNTVISVSTNAVQVHMAHGDSVHELPDCTICGGY